MTFEQVLQFIRDPKIQRVLADETSTDFQKAADIHAMLYEAHEPKAERKVRKVKPPAPVRTTDHTDSLV